MIDYYRYYLGNLTDTYYSKNQGTINQELYTLIGDLNNIISN